MSTTKIYFPNLNGLRFLAAAFVILHHIELVKSWFGIKNYYSSDAVYYIGKLGVILFFVLSGFLITYLLLAEKKARTISISQFYMRRILRIWPLYFLIVILSFLILPHLPLFNITTQNFLHEKFYVKLFLFMFFLPNIAIVYFNPVTYAAQAWSIGVEEQFYLVWPWIIKYITKPLLFFILFIIIFNSLEFVLYYLGTHFTKPFKLLLLMADNKENFKANWLYFFKNCYFNWLKIKEVLNIDCMAIGGIGAYLAYYQSKVLLYLFNKYVQWAIYAVVIFMLISGFHFHYFTYEIYAILFLIIILNLAINPKTILHFKFPVFDYLGKISYGLYMYHFIGIVISMRITYLIFNNYNNSSVYLFSFAITILISGISYRFLEDYFIKMKLGFSQIISGDNVHYLKQRQSKN